MLAVTSVPPQPVERIESPDVPTIYNVRLGEIGSAQVYLDPGAPGRNDLHVTFFDPNGAALPVESVTIAARSETRGGTIPTPRLLDTGHYVASLDVDAGPLLVDAVSPPLTGTGLVHLHVTIEVEP
jgi:hypothetical protein